MGIAGDVRPVRGLVLGAGISGDVHPVRARSGIGCGNSRGCSSSERSGIGCGNSRG